MLGPAIGNDVVVVGSGVAGLSCAYALASAGASVRIVARSVPPATTSNVAAAFWYPYCAFPRPRVLGWAARSWRRFAELAQDPSTGVRMAQALEVLRQPAPERPWWCDAAAEVTAARREQLPPGFEAGWAFVAPVVDTRRYLAWLCGQVQALGVVTERVELSTLGQALADARTVIDCAGLGARALVPDPQVRPIRGQLVLVRNPGLTRVVLDEHNPHGVAYVVPRGDDCVLGGTTDVDIDDRRSRATDREAILRRCIAIEPRLARAQVLADVVGLRPGRASVRVQAEVREGGLVVHNYGHGGAGVTLSWGCAFEVAELVAQHARGARREVGA